MTVNRPGTQGFHWWAARGSNPGPVSYPAGITDETTLRGGQQHSNNTPKPKRPARSMLYEKINALLVTARDNPNTPLGDELSRRRGRQVWQNYRLPFLVRFWVRVVERESGCWDWIGSRDRYGYGRVMRDRKTIRTHRFSWEQRHGEIPDGLHVLHDCDNPACINPDHLRLGTHQDNMADREARGRRRTRELNPPLLDPQRSESAGLRAKRHPNCRPTNAPRAPLIAIALLALATPALAQTNVTIEGDSISSCAFDTPRGDCWPEILKRNGPYRIVNLSVGGTTAQQWAQEPAIGLHYTRWPVNYGLIALGGNDGALGRTWSEFGMDVMAIADRMFAAGADRVILLLMPTFNGPFPESTLLREQYNDVQQAICDAIEAIVCFDVTFMPASYFPVFTSQAGVEFIGAHPTKEGHVWLAFVVRVLLDGI